MDYKQAIQKIVSGIVCCRRETPNGNNVKRTWEPLVLPIEDVCCLHEMIVPTMPARMYLDLEHDASDEYTLERFEAECERIVALLGEPVVTRHRAHRPEKHSMHIVFPMCGFEHAGDIGAFLLEKLGPSDVIDYSVYSERAPKSIRMNGTYKIERGRYVHKLVSDGSFLDSLVIPPGVKIPIKYPHRVTIEQPIAMPMSVSSILNIQLKMCMEWIKLNTGCEAVTIQKFVDETGHGTIKVKGIFCKNKRGRHVSNQMFINFKFAASTFRTYCVCCDSDCRNVEPYKFYDEHMLHELFL